MGNCLVTKLKAAVDNDNLLKLGEARIEIVNSGEARALQLNAKATKVSFSQATPVIVNGVSRGTISEFTYAEDQQLGLITIPSGNFTISIENKYDNVFTIDQSSLTGNASLKLRGFNLSNINDITLNNNTVAINIDELKGNTILYKLFLGTNSGVEGSMESLAGCSNLVQIEFVSTNVTGSIMNLKDCLNITRLVVGCNHPQGESLEPLFNSWASSGKNTTGDGVFVSTRDYVFNEATNDRFIYVKFGTGMVDPTAEDTARGWQWTY